MSPFGNLYGIPVYVEKSLTGQETMAFPVGTYTDTMASGMLTLNAWCIQR
jgi:Ala-tRNA(Pro) deacylase